MRRGELNLKTDHFHLPGFPVTYYLTFDYKQVDRNDPDVSVKLHCYCDYNDVKIEADIKFILKANCRELEVGETQYTYGGDNTEVICYDKTKCKHFNAGLYFILKGTFIAKGLHLNPLSIKVPKIYKFGQ
uniref:Uncharacterized protein n=1 Tax=Panagrolaimus sp. PS1159 TaxID=55785 RepID=A0AC35F0G8_9BILA